MKKAIFEAKKHTRNIALNNAIQQFFRILSFSGVYGHDISMFWDGSYVVLFNNTWRIYDSDYNRTPVYGDDIWIVSSGRYKCQRGSYIAVYNIDGSRAY